MRKKNSVKKSHRLKSPNSTKTHVRIAGEGRDEQGDRYIKFVVEGSDHDIPPVSVKQLISDPSQLFEALGNAGYNGFTTKTRNELLRRLERRGPRAPTFRVVTRLGWNSGAYVLPDLVTGKPKIRLERAFAGLDGAMLAKYRARGSLAQWRNKIAVPCSGNSRLMFSICVAFSGPILRFVKGPRAGGFQICGFPESGKTTVVMVAGSVWGCHRNESRREKGFAESWNSTAGKVEVTALAHSDVLLILDETKQAGASARTRAEVVTSVIFGLAEMTEKERLNNPGSVRSWRCYFLSTSNMTLTKLANEGKIDIDEASLGRMADIPLPDDAHGIYEQLHDFASGEALSDALQRRSRRYYGTPGRVFVQKLAEEREADKRSLKKFLDNERKAYRNELRKKISSRTLKPLKRSSGRYATAFAAGSLACKYGILPWSREEILAAILKCQLDQLRQPEQVEHVADESPEALRGELISYLEKHQRQFQDLKTNRPKLGSDLNDALGYCADFKGESYYYLTEGRLQRIIGTGKSATALKQMLVTEKLLTQGPDGRLVVQRTVFTGGKGSKNCAWVHAIKTSILAPKPSAREAA